MPEFIASAARHGIEEAARPWAIPRLTIAVVHHLLTFSKSLNAPPRSAAATISGLDPSADVWREFAHVAPMTPKQTFSPVWTRRASEAWRKERAALQSSMTMVGGSKRPEALSIFPLLWMPIADRLVSTL